MLFKRGFHDGLASGAITLSFRLWSAPRVKVGSRYRCPPIGWLEVDAIDKVSLASVSEEEARRSGFAGREALIAFLRKSSRVVLGEETEVFRVELRYGGPDDSGSIALEPRLSPEEGNQLRVRLEKMDRLSRHGAWTMETLALIAEHPRTAASRLAVMVGRETRPFKADVRRLKKLGLTVSHEVGYQISPRGEVFLAMLENQGARSCRHTVMPERRKHGESA